MAVRPNKSEGSIPTTRRPQNGTVEYALWRFALIANKTSPHPLDWKRFYEFVVIAHQRRVGWDEGDVQAKLKKFGFDQQHAADLANAYWHGRCTLYISKPRLLLQ